MTFWNNELGGKTPATWSKRPKDSADYRAEAARQKLRELVYNGDPIPEAVMDRVYAYAYAYAQAVHSDRPGR